MAGAVTRFASDLPARRKVNPGNSDWGRPGGGRRAQHDRRSTYPIRDGASRAPFLDPFPRGFLASVREQDDGLITHRQVHSLAGYTKATSPRSQPAHIAD